MPTKLAVRALIVHEGKFLLVKHHGSEYYALPGGKLDADENLKSGLVRELQEELGISAEIGALKYIQEFRYPDGGYSLEFFFSVSNPEAFLDISGGTHADVELAEFGWFDSLKDLSGFKPEFLIADEEILRSGGLNEIRYHSLV